MIRFRLPEIAASLFPILCPVALALSGCEKAPARFPAQAAGEVAAAPASTASEASSAPHSQSEEIARWCKDVSHEASSFKWKIDPCTGIDWKVGGHSVEGRPLVYGEFGSADSRNITLVFSAVHGDEITPVYLGLRLVRWLQENPEELKGVRVIVAPLVNPDGFFRKPRTRMNAHGVDVNRNFDTSDWRAKALVSWKKRFRSDPRRFPGNEPASEPETKFQVDLLQKVRPHKVLSIHSPLNFLDYDGPTPLSLATFPQDYVKRCLQLRNRLKAVSGGFYPGSLGNYAGRELGIPTLTLELPTANANMAEAYWKKFNQGVHTMIRYELPSGNAFQEKLHDPAQETTKVSKSS